MSILKFDFNNILNTYTSTVGSVVSSLGDDTLMSNVCKANISLDDAFYTSSCIYTKVAEWDVEASKSLVGLTTGEYLREQSHGGYYCKVKMSNKTFEGEFKYVTCLCKPSAHVLKTSGWSENLSRISHLIDEVGLISKVMNLNLHPRVDIIINKMIEYGIPRFKLFTEPIDYVPIWNTKAWVKAGKPQVPNKYSVTVGGVDAAFALAGKEAEWYTANIMKNSQSADTTLYEALGVGWTKSNMADYDHISSLKSSRVYRILVAMYKNDTIAVDKIVKEVVEIPNISEFYDELNGLTKKDVDKTDVLDPELIN